MCEVHLAHLSSESRAPFAARAITVLPATTLPSRAPFSGVVPSPRAPAPAAHATSLPLPRGATHPLGNERSQSPVCATSGVLAARALPLEHAIARVCAEAGAQVARNLRLADMNLEAPVGDERHLEGRRQQPPSQLALDAGQMTLRGTRSDSQQFAKNPCGLQVLEGQALHEPVVVVLFALELLGDESIMPEWGTEECDPWGVTTSRGGSSPAALQMRVLPSCRRTCACSHGARAKASPAAAPSGGSSPMPPVATSAPPAHSAADAPAEPNAAVGQAPPSASRDCARGSELGGTVATPREPVLVDSPSPAEFATTSPQKGTSAGATACMEAAQERSMRDGIVSAAAVEQHYG